MVCLHNLQNLNLVEGNTLHAPFGLKSGLRSSFLEDMVPCAITSYVRSATSRLFTVSLHLLFMCFQCITHNAASYSFLSLHKDVISFT